MANRFLILVSVLFAVVCGVQAQTYYRLGFCGWQVAEVSSLPVEDVKNMDAAIFLSASDLARFSGDSFMGVNVGLSSKLNVQAVEVWIREALDGTNLATQSIDIRTSQKPRDGWNNIKFDEPLPIENGKGYYVGYSLTLLKASANISFVEGSAPEAAWVKMGDGEWSDHSDLGVLSLEALIGGDNLPQLDLQLDAASFREDYILNDGPVTLSYQIRNVGMTMVNSYKMRIEAEGTDLAVEKTIYQNLNYGVSRNYQETFSFPGLAAGRPYDFKVSVLDPNGSEEETPEGNSKVIAGVPVIDHVFPRTVLLEEFTTERCSNCPGAAAIVHEMVEGFSEEEADRFAMVCHHSGFYTDDFTLPCDEPYLWFYNDEGRVYAPAFMIDRQEEGNTNTPVFLCPDVRTFSNKIVVAQQQPALYSIDITGDYLQNEKGGDSEGVLELRVSGEAVYHAFDNPRITVYVTEDDVEPSKRGQSGTGGQPFLHQHVERAYNATWGEPAEWDGTDFSYECKLDIPSGCKPGYMKVIAFISNFNGSDPLGCEIGNVAWLPMAALIPDCVDQSLDECPVYTRIYDLTGSELCSGPDIDHLGPGVYIVVKTTPTSRSSHKILVK